MDRDSSVYVDRVVIDKLITEKLGKVSHRCNLSVGRCVEPFRQMASIDPLPMDMQRRGSRRWLMRSALKSPYEHNNSVPVHYRPAKNERSILLFAHGLFEDNPEIYNYLFSQLHERQVSIYWYTLPFHYERKPSQSAFGGEFFWSADLIRTINSFEQSVYDLYQLYNWLCDRHPSLPVSLAGFSMGAGMAMMLTTVAPSIRRVFLINPICTFSEMIWTGPLNVTVKRDLLHQNITLEQVNEIFSPYNPENLPNIEAVKDNIAIAYGRYDQINPLHYYQALSEKWRFKKVILYKAGHLNTLRVPRLAQDLETFINQN
jgi:alpha/beta superfamily hydrolase